MTPEGLLFAETHEWASVSDEGGYKVATIGLSAHAIEQLTDLVYMDAPNVGDKVTAGQAFSEVESVKATSDLYSPVDGEIIEVNTELFDNLEILNDDPYGAGWIVKVKLSDESALASLMDSTAYDQQNA